MQSLLLRVGIDSGNVGYVGPICQKTREYVYIPIPANEEALSKRRYGTEEVQPSKSVFGGKVLADFMHSDSANVCLDYDWVESVRTKKDVWIKRRLPAKDMNIHFDPEFDGNTYGDFSGNRIPLDWLDSLDRQETETHLFFYSGLAPYPECFEKRLQSRIRNSQTYNMNVYIIGHFEIQRAYSIRSDGDLSVFRDKLGTNAHFVEKEHLKGLENHPVEAEREHFSKLVIIKGKKSGSRGLLDKAIQLTEWSDSKGVYVPNDLGKKAGLKPSSGIRQTPHLGRKGTVSLLDAIDTTR